jgi:hypothetical protein
MPLEEDEQHHAFSSQRFGVSFFYPTDWRQSDVMTSNHIEVVESYVFTSTWINEEEETEEPNTLIPDTSTVVELFRREDGELPIDAYGRLFKQEVEGDDVQLSVIKIHDNEALMMTTQNSETGSHTQRLLLAHNTQQYWISISATYTTPVMTSAQQRGHQLIKESITLF